jgi:hypothetical protein
MLETITNLLNCVHLKYMFIKLLNFMLDYQVDLIKESQKNEIVQTDTRNPWMTKQFLTQLSHQ